MKAQRATLRRRPTTADVTDCFDFSEEELIDPADGEMLLQTLWLSIEPYMMLSMKGQIAPKPRPSSSRPKLLAALYASGVELGADMCGPTVCRVLKSRNPRFIEGDLVSAYSGWRTHAIDNGLVARQIPVGAAPLSAHLGVLGIPGMTGYAGMRAIGKPAVNDTVVISAPMGAVGAVAADVARQSGARTVGITSGPQKCRQLVQSLGFDAAVDRLDPAFAQLLAEACPRGIDVYFENAGGPIWDAVLPLLRFFARVPVSGLVADYAPDAVGGGGPDRLQLAMKKIQTHRITVRGLAVFDHAELEEEFTENTVRRIGTGELRYLEQTFEGLERAPEALGKVLSGRTVGKAVVRLSAE